MEILKIKTTSKSEDSLKVLRLLENLKIESSDNSAMINSLKIENSTLTAEKVNLEKCIADLKKTIKDREIHNGHLQKHNVSKNYKIYDKKNNVFIGIYFSMKKLILFIILYPGILISQKKTISKSGIFCNFIMAYEYLEIEIYKKNKKCLNRIC